MGWWEDLSSAASNLVDTVADVVQTVVDTAGDVVADSAETAGNAAADGLTSLGASRLGDVVSGVTNVAGAVIKAVFGIVSGTLGGVIRIIGGMLTLNGDLILKGVIDIASSIVGALVFMGGTLLGLFQRIFPVQTNDRSLTKKERELLRSVFFNSVSLYNVRLIEGASGAFGINNNDRAFTLGNTIYLKNDDPKSRPDILVHETVHVWQYQNTGSRYTTDALGAQAVYGDAAYYWEAELARGHSDWNDFNKEAQAQLIQDIWRFGSLTVNGHTTDGSGSFFDLQDAQGTFADGAADFVFNGTDYTELATAAVASLRARLNLRWSKSF